MPACMIPNKNTSPWAAWHSKEAEQAERKASPLRRSPSTSWASWWGGQGPGWWQCQSSRTAEPWWSYCPIPSRCQQSASSYASPWSLSLQNKVKYLIPRLFSILKRVTFQHTVNNAPLKGFVGQLSKDSANEFIWNIACNCWPQLDVAPGGENVEQIL